MIVTCLITLALCLVHLVGDHIGRKLDTSEHLVHSVGGGMAIAYVFLHLLPELEAGHKLLGQSIHLIALAGFVIYYAAEHWIAHNDETRSGGFKLRLMLYATYNWLIIYSLPDAVSAGTGYALLLALALGLHLLSSDYHLRSQYPQQFSQYGRWVLIAALLAGLATDILLQPDEPFIKDIWTALLSGFVLSTVFRDEAPDHRTAQFAWFFSGVAGYAMLTILLH